MPIEFRCPNCSKLLRVADSAAGMQAKCPACAHQMQVPAATPPDAASQGPVGGPASFGPAAGPQGQYAENPYQSPQSSFQPPTAAPVPGGPVRPTVIDVGEVLNQSWEIFKRQIGMCIVAGLIVGAIVGAAPAIFQVVTTQVAEAMRSIPLMILAILASTALRVVLFAWIGAGQVKFFLRVARGYEPDLADLFSGTPYFANMLGATILMGLAVLAGTALCIVPGVFVALMFSQYKYLIVDRNAGAIDSLSSSYELTNGNKLNIFVLWIVTFLVTCLGMCACFVGVIVAAPFAILMMTVAYLNMTGQPTGAYYQGPQPPVLR